MSAPTALKGQYLPSFWLKKTPAGHIMPKFTEWLCLVGVSDNLLGKDKGEGVPVSDSYSGLDMN